MTSRYTHASTLHNRDGARTNTLFDAYTGDNDIDHRREKTRRKNDPGGGGGGGGGVGGPANNSNGNGRLAGAGAGAGGAGGSGYGYGYGGYSHAYANGSASAGAGGTTGGGYRPATPNSRGQYSDAVLSSLESQNDAQIEGLSGKVKMLKDITLAIGDEIRDSTALTEKMNDQFDSTRSRIKGTMNRMLRMAERTGVGWKVWLLFFAAVVGLFLWVWLF